MDIPARISKKKDSRSLDGSSDGSLLEPSQMLNEHFEKDSSRLGEFLQNQLEVVHRTRDDV